MFPPLGGHPAREDADDGHTRVLLPHQRNQLPSRRRRRPGMDDASDILVLKHESRKIRYFWVIRKFKVLVFCSGWFGLLPAAA